MVPTSILQNSQLIIYQSYSALASSTPNQRPLITHITSTHSIMPRVVLYVGFNHTRSFLLWKWNVRRRLALLFLLCVFVCVLLFPRLLFSSLTHSLYIHTVFVCICVERGGSGQAFIWWIDLSIFLALFIVKSSLIDQGIFLLYFLFFYSWITCFFLILICLTWVFISDSWFLCSNLDIYV